MCDTTDNEPRTRRDRLTAIADEYTEEIHDPRTQRQLGGNEPIFRFAAVTSEGSPESSHASNGNLLLADSTDALAELLRQECGEGWIAHGRVWDLDSPWHLWGNLEVAYSVVVGKECARDVHTVVVEGREHGVFLFDDLVDAEAFRAKVRMRGDQAELSEEPINGHREADRLIDAERRH
jgi:hypothetical protein